MNSKSLVKKIGTVSSEPYPWGCEANDNCGSYIYIYIYIYEIGRLIGNRGVTFGVGLICS